MQNRRALHPYFHYRHIGLFHRRPPAPPPPVMQPKPVPPPPTGVWTGLQICEAYDWPTNLKGGGVICIVELNGGWTQADLNANFAAVNLPAPFVADVSVDGTKNSPSGINGADPEVMLDIVYAALSYYAATGKMPAVYVYWGQSIAGCVLKAAADHGNAIVFAASGDNDSSDGGSTPANVDAPASCPHVIGVGGTSLAHGGMGGKNETVWNDNPGQAMGEGTGGGYSTHFATQSWQIGVPVAPKGLGRMVPDMAANADPQTGYQLWVDGQWITVGGTSIATPIIAGLFAAIGFNVTSISWGADEADWGATALDQMEAAALASVGGAEASTYFVAPMLYEHPDVFNQNIVGNNGDHSEPPNPGPCTGLGSPIGKLIAALFMTT
jgi:kumamolisin